MHGTFRKVFREKTSHGLGSSSFQHTAGVPRSMTNIPCRFQIRGSKDEWPQPAHRDAGWQSLETDSSGSTLLTGLPGKPDRYRFDRHGSDSPLSPAQLKPQLRTETKQRNSRLRFKIASMACKQLILLSKEQSPPRPSGSAERGSPTKCARWRGPQWQVCPGCTNTSPSNPLMVVFVCRTDPGELKMRAFQLNSTHPIGACQKLTVKLP